MSKDSEIDFFEIFPWNKNFEVGIDIIDEQHKKLVNILNRLAAHFANLSSSIVLNEIFEELADYADYHFSTEEKIWSKYFKDDEWFINHEHTHDSFIAEVVKIKNKQDDKTLNDVVNDIVSFLSQWLAYHILDTDKRMGKVVLSMQAGKTIDEAKIISNDEMNGSMKLLVDTVLTMYDSLSVRTLDLMREKTLRRNAEKSLYLNEERWKLIIDGGLENIWDFNIKYNESEKIEDDYLIEVLNKNISKNKENYNIHPLDIKKVLSSLKEHLFGETPQFICKYRLENKSKSWSWILSRGKVVSINSNTEVRLVGTSTDITKSELASIIYENSSQAMFISDAKNNIISINPAFSEITGYEIDELIGKNPKVLSSKEHDKHFYKKMWGKIIETGSWNGEIKNKKKNGEIFIENLNINTSYNKDGDIDHYVALFNDISEKKQKEEIIYKQANFDSLTQLNNRKMFQSHYEEEIIKSSQSKLPFALLFIDLDHFKDINDSFGHEVGDQVLIKASRRILKNINKIDSLGRFGGDEFILISSELEDITRVEIVANNIIESLSKPFYIKDQEVHISASIGIAIYPNDSKDFAELLKNANQAMNGAKKLGRRQFKYYKKSMQKEAERRQWLLSGLYKSLELNQLEIYYQAIVDLKTNKVNKAEALLRWNHPTEGLIYPSEFIPLLESSGLIVSVGDWVYTEAVKQVGKWKTQFDNPLQISINKSPIQFKAMKSLKKWFDLLKENNLTGSNICIEITESLLMESKESIVNKLLEYRNQGIDISIDDFGTGYSSLSYIKTFDIDYLKIDRSFIKNLKADSQDMVLCEAMILMAHKLGIKVIAEGIETQEQKDLLLQMNCDYGQGYLFSKPIPASEFERLFLI